VRDLVAGALEVIRIDAAFFAVEPLDIRAGVDTALARVVSVFGEARAHHAYLFVNKRANRMKVLVHDGFGLWLCARRLYEGSFIRAGMTHDRGLPRTSSCKRSSSGFRGRGSMSVSRSECSEK
jgi:transposase